MPLHASRLARILRSAPSVLALALPLALATWSSPAVAQDDTPPPKKTDAAKKKKKTDAQKAADTDAPLPPPTPPPPPDPPKDDAPKDDAKKDDAKKPDAAADGAVSTSTDTDPSEDPSKTYRFIGVRYRDAIAPKFIINWFANGGRNVNVPMVGPEFISRKDHLEVNVALMYADYSFDPFLFQGKSDPSNSWELVTSSLKLGYAMVDIMYEVPIDKKGDKTGSWAFLVGGGVGIAGVFGSLYRSQAYPNNAAAAGNPSDPTQWTPCASANVPGKYSGSYCNSRSNHFWPGWSASNPNAAGPGAYSEPSWANGGSKPLIFPWIALPQFAFRYKPIKQFQTKLDFGFSTSGFWFGLSASYGLPSG